MTDPEKRGDPWKEALNCYNCFSDELIVVGEDWPEEFKFSQIGEYFQQGFDKCTGDWVLRMDIDYFFHERDINKLLNILKKYENSPVIFFPQYQFFTPNRFHLKTRLGIAVNKKRFPNIKFNGGGDLCLPTLDDKILNYDDNPRTRIPIFQYDSMFRTKEIISRDRARFARAWFREFNNYGDRGGPDEESAYNAWFEMIEKKYIFHTNKIRLDRHPKFILNKLESLDETQFGFNAFGLSKDIRRPFKYYLKGVKERFFD